MASDVRAYVQELEQRLYREMAHHNIAHEKLKQRSEFLNWMKLTYPEIVAQYEAAMRLVDFAVDPPPPDTKFDFSWDDKGNFYGSK